MSMTLKEALERLPYKIEGIMNLAEMPILEAIKRTQKRYIEVRSDCKSDEAYWGRVKVLSAWRAANMICMASFLMEDADLSEVKLELREDCLNNIGYSIEIYGQEILELAKVDRSKREIDVLYFLGC